MITCGSYTVRVSALKFNFKNLHVHTGLKTLQIIEDDKTLS